MTITLDDKLEKCGEILLWIPEMTHAELLAFSERNPLLPVELTAKGYLSIRAPIAAFQDSRNMVLLGDLTNWNRSLAVPGLAFGPSAGFTLANRAVRAPDAAWIPAERWLAIPDNLRSPFAYIAPDFVAEIMSPSDRLAKAQEKMDEYMANGVRLGWLVDRINRTVYVYRPNAVVEVLSDPATVSGDPELPGLVINMARVLQDTL